MFIDHTRHTFWTNISVSLPLIVCHSHTQAQWLFVCRSKTLNNFILTTSNSEQLIYYSLQRFACPSFFSFLQRGLPVPHSTLPCKGLPISLVPFRIYWSQTEHNKIWEKNNLVLVIPHSLNNCVLCSDSDPLKLRVYLSSTICSCINTHTPSNRHFFKSIQN